MIFTSEDDSEYQGYSSAEWAQRARKAEATVAEMRMMLLKLAKKPFAYTEQEIVDAVHRWDGPANPLRAPGSTASPVSQTDESGPRS